MTHPQATHFVSSPTPSRGRKGFGSPPGCALRVFANPLPGAALAAWQSQFRGALDRAASLAGTASRTFIARVGVIDNGGTRTA